MPADRLVMRAPPQGEATPCRPPAGPVAGPIARGSLFCSHHSYYQIQFAQSWVPAMNLTRTTSVTTTILIDNARKRDANHPRTCAGAGVPDGGEPVASATAATASCEGTAAAKPSGCIRPEGDRGGMMRLLVCLRWWGSWFTGWDHRRSPWRPSNVLLRGCAGVPP
jgi:hypothetical protein